MGLLPYGECACYRGPSGHRIGIYVPFGVPAESGRLRRIRSAEPVLHQAVVRLHVGGAIRWEGNACAAKQAVHSPPTLGRRAERRST